MPTGSYTKLALEDPDHESNDERSMKQRSHDRSRRLLRFLLRILIEICALGFLYALVFSIDISRWSTSREPLGYPRLSQDLRQPPTILTTFAPDQTFAGYSNESAAAWGSLMPSERNQKSYSRRVDELTKTQEGRGYVLIENPSRLGLQPGIRVTETADRYSISAFHQLHCLAIIPEAYYELKLGLTSTPHNHGGSGVHSSVAPQSNAHLHEDGDHLDHCFDYIRQAIMCTADPAIEPARVDDEGVRRDVDGWGAEHQCRSWEPLFEFAVKNRGYDREGII